MSLEEAIDIIVDMDGFLDNGLTIIDYLKLKQKIIKLYEESPAIKDQNENIPAKGKPLVKNLFVKKSKD